MTEKRKSYPGLISANNEIPKGRQTRFSLDLVEDQELFMNFIRTTSTTLEDAKKNSAASLLNSGRNPFSPISSSKSNSKDSKEISLDTRRNSKFSTKSSQRSKSEVTDGRRRSSIGSLITNDKITSKLNNLSINENHNPIIMQNILRNDSHGSLSTHHKKEMVHRSESLASIQYHPNSILKNFEGTTYNQNITIRDSISSMRSEASVYTNFSIRNPVETEMEEKLFKMFICTTGRRRSSCIEAETKINLDKFIQAMENTGLNIDKDPRLIFFNHQLRKIKQINIENHTYPVTIRLREFHEIVHHDLDLIHQALTMNFVIPNFKNFKSKIEEIFEAVGSKPLKVAPLTGLLKNRILCLPNWGEDCLQHKCPREGQEVTTTRILVNDNNSKKIKGNKTNPKTKKTTTKIKNMCTHYKNHFAVSVCTIDGQRIDLGDCDVSFIAESMIKPLTYAMTLSEYGIDHVHRFVGQNPAGKVNDLVSETKLNYEGKPHNPMVNGGAIVNMSLLKPELNNTDRFDYAFKKISEASGNVKFKDDNINTNNPGNPATKNSMMYTSLIGNLEASPSIISNNTRNRSTRHTTGSFFVNQNFGNNELQNQSNFETQELRIDNDTEYVDYSNSAYLSLSKNAHHDNCLCFFMKENKCFPEKINKKPKLVQESLELFWQMNSILFNTKSASVAAATLASGGICPLTGKQVFKSDIVKHVLTLMLSCGMNDYSGQSAFQIGLPAKSGLSGGLMIVVPNVCGICCYAPEIDEHGNSYRGLKFAEYLEKTFNFHLFEDMSNKAKNSFLSKFGFFEEEENDDDDDDQSFSTASDHQELSSYEDNCFRNDSITYKDNKGVLEINLTDAILRRSSAEEEEDPDSDQMHQKNSLPAKNKNFTKKKKRIQIQKIDPRKVTEENSHDTDLINMLYSAHKGDLSALMRYYLNDFDMNMPNYDGRTALHVAATENHYDCVEYLVKYAGVDPNSCDRWGRTPLENAQMMGHDQVAEMLRDFMDKINF